MHRLLTSQVLADPQFLAGDVTGWIDSKRAWAQTTIYALFLLFGVAIVAWLLIKTRGAFAKLFGVAIGVAILYMIITHIPEIAAKFGTELNNQGLPAPVHQVDPPGARAVW